MDKTAKHLLSLVLSPKEIESKMESRGMFSNIPVNSSFVQDKGMTYPDITLELDDAA